MEGLVFSGNNYFLLELEHWQEIKLALLIFYGGVGKLIEIAKAVLTILQDTCLPSNWPKQGTIFYPFKNAQKKLLQVLSMTDSLKYSESWQLMPGEKAFVLWDSIQRAWISVVLILICVIRCYVFFKPCL